MIDSFEYSQIIRPDKFFKSFADFEAFIHIRSGETDNQYYDGLRNLLTQCEYYEMYEECQLIIKILENEKKTNNFEKLGQNDSIKAKK